MDKDTGHSDFVWRVVLGVSIAIASVFLALLLFFHRQEASEKEDLRIDSPACIACIEEEGEEWN